MAKEVTDKELMQLYRARLKDRTQARSRRRKRLENTPQAFGDLLSQFFKNDPEATRRLEENRVILAWPACVGDCAARASEALKIRNGTLIVYVPDPLWMQQLSLLKYEVLKKYREAFPSLPIRDIFFTRRRS
jgi:predicted nucleic acid-binding Zn ribbon protein